MQLSDIRNEVYAKGFAETLYTSARVNQFINDGYLKVCRRVQYYVDEAVSDFPTVAGTILYPFPANFARLRHIYDTSRDVRLLSVSLREIDNSGLPGSGPPMYYALDGTNLHLWPTPDNVYPLELRYWLLPTALVNDGDVPTLPADYHKLLWQYATAECYKSDDDFGTAAQWMQDFDKTLAEFSADQKFPDSETPDVAKSFWDQERGLTQKGWSLWGWL